MSAQATGWALRLPGLDPTAKLVLVTLGDYAHPDGSRSYPSVQTLAETVGVSERTVQRCLRLLLERGLIVKGEQAFVAHLRVGHRPIVYDLQLGGEDRRSVTPAGPSGVTPTTGRGDTSDVSGATPVSPNPKDLTQTPEPKEHLLDEASSEPLAAPWFEVFWTTYPRKVGKRAAVKAWDRSVKSAAPAVIIAAAARYRDDPNRDPAFTAHPTTWLNQGRWDDDPLPARPGHSAYVDPTPGDYASGWMTDDDLDDGATGA